MYLAANSLSAWQKVKLENGKSPIMGRAHMSLSVSKAWFVMFVGTGWVRQGPRHGRFQLWRPGPLWRRRPLSGAFGSGASAVAGGSAYAASCVIAGGAGKSTSTVRCFREMDEASVS